LQPRSFARRARWRNGFAPEGFGLGGILTPTGLGTIVAEGKQVIAVDGRQYLLETPLTAVFSLIAAHRSDYRGNLE